MSTLTIQDKSALSGMIDTLERTSPRLAQACRYLGDSLRASYLKLAAAVEQGDVAEAATQAERIRESDLLAGIAGKFHDLREKASDLWDALRPWAKVIFGLTVGIAGAFLAAELGLILSAILLIGGFLYAIRNALELMLKKGTEHAPIND